MLGYTSIEDRFFRDRGFRRMMLAQGWQDHSIHVIDDVAMTALHDRDARRVRFVRQPHTSTATSTWRGQKILSIGRTLGTMSATQSMTTGANTSGVGENGRSGETTVNGSGMRLRLSRANGRVPGVLGTIDEEVRQY